MLKAMDAKYLKAKIQNKYLLKGMCDEDFQKVLRNEFLQHTVLY